MGGEHQSCGGNCGGCTGCSGCGGGLLMTESELRILEVLGQYAFLPVARRMDTMEPNCLEEGLPGDATTALQLLERKNLISIDYDAPMKGFDYSAYTGLPVHGCISLTGRGQEVLETLDVLGIDD
ncbi:MAG: hypothetical protein E7459_10285 [Ruminococcaceae bacterium]|nr:hypothetical protein [Oscillospiraceae bacterium]